MIYRERKNPIYVCFSSIQEATFTIMRKCLENNVVNVTIYLILIIYETYQAVPFFLVIGLRVADKHPVGLERYESIFDIVNLISVTKIVLQANFYTLTIFSFALLAIYVFSIVAMIYSKTNKKNHKEEVNSSKILTWIFKFLSLFFVLCGTWLSQIIGIWLFLPFSCNYDHPEPTLDADSNIICWTGIHIAIVVINGIDLLLHIACLVMLEMLFTDTSPRSRIPWASTQANKMRYLKHLSKLILSFFIVLDDRANYYNYLFVLEILIHCLIIYIVFISPSYINRIAGRTVLFLEFYTLGTMIGMYICRLTDILMQRMVFLVIEVLLLMISGIVVFVKMRYDAYILTIEVTRNRSESIKEYYFYELFRLLDNYGNGTYDVDLNLYGIYTNHQLLCKNATCRCCTEILNKNINLEKLKDESEGDQNGPNPNGEGQYEGLANSFRASMISMFQIGINKSNDYLQKPETKQEENKETEENIRMENYKSILNICSLIIDYEVANSFASITLRMISAYYFREYIGNALKSMYELIFIEEKQKPSLRDQFLIYKYKKSIDEEISSLAKKATADSTVDVEKIMAFENHYEIFRKQTEIASNIINRFWEQLKSKDLDVNGLYEIGSKVGIIYKEMQTNYLSAIEIFPHNFKMFNEFGSFEKYIMNNDLIAKNYEMKAKQISKEQAEQNREGIQNYENDLVDSNSTNHTFICVVSGNPNSMGDIVGVNTEIVQTLGFKPKEIIGQNCGVICPQYISSKHNQIIENFIMRGTSTFLKTRQIITACNSEGFLVLLEAFIKLFPSLDEGIRFIGIFKTLRDYSELFKEKDVSYSANDVAIIVTSQDGQIYGINEVCMTRMGIPVSLFKPKAVPDDAIMISTFIKDVTELDNEDKLLKKGMNMSFNTKALQFSINKENLTKKEVRALKSKADKYKIFIKLSNESYGNGLIKLKVYKMIILSREVSSDKVQDTNAKLGVSPAGNEAEQSKNNLKRQSSDKEEGKSSCVDNEQSIISSGNLKELCDLKQSMNTKSSAINVSTIKCGINLMFILLIGLASTVFGLLITDKKESSKGVKIIFSANKRVIDVGMIESFALVMNYTANNTSLDYTYGDVDIYKYVEEYGYRSISNLKNEQDYLNTLKFSYSPILNDLEKGILVNVVTRSTDNTNYTTPSSINTAITQYNGQAANFFAISFDTLSKLKSINSEYFFIKENGIGNISLVANKSETEFRNSLDDMVGKYLYYCVGITIFIGVSFIIALFIVVPKLIGLQREKINVFMLYAQMNRREVDIQMDKCMQYQKSKGFLDYDEVADAEDSKDSSNSSDEMQEQIGVPMVTKVEFEQVAGKELVPSHEEEEEEESDSDEDSSEQSVKDENEMTIQEHINSEKLRSKLSTNALSLVIMIVLLCCIYFTYFIASSVKHVYDSKNIMDAFSFINGISGMLNTPLYLLLYTYVSASETRTITISEEESIMYYMNQFLNSAKFKQIFIFANDGFLNDIQKIFNNLDSEKFCATIMNSYKAIQSEYPPQAGLYSYDFQNKITTDLCNSYSNGLLSRGIMQASFMVYYNVKKLREERNVNIYKHDLTSTVEMLILMQLFLAPAYESLLIELRNSINNSLSSLQTFLILFYVFYTVIAFLAHFTFWTCYLRSTESELVKSRGMLKIMPIMLIDKLKKMSKENENNQSIQFFKAFENNYQPISFK